MQDTSIQKFLNVTSLNRRSASVLPRNKIKKRKNRYTSYHGHVMLHNKSEDANANSQQDDDGLGQTRTEG